MTKAIRKGLLTSVSRLRLWYSYSCHYTVRNGFAGMEQQCIAAEVDTDPTSRSRGLHAEVARELGHYQFNTSSAGNSNSSSSRFQRSKDSWDYRSYRHRRRVVPHLVHNSQDKSIKPLSVNFEPSETNQTLVRYYDSHFSEPTIPHSVPSWPRLVR